MPTMASIVGNDPLARFLQEHAADKHPIPLTATRIDVTIRGGLASVTTERTLRNSEPQSIEATMTFPVPVDATLCSLVARIGGRTLNAVAKARAQARATYEDAVDRGKAAALHEELLKGIHMLSVAHVKPGAEIVVTDTWTVPLSFVGGEPRLRIPVTVGDIYGCSPLAADDDLVTASHVHEASIAIQCDNGTASLMRAATASDGRRTVTLDAPIDIVLSGWNARQLVGLAADGRHVTLDIEPAPAADASLDIDLLFDHSGSMAEAAVGDREVRGTKFDVAKVGLLRAVGRGSIKAADKLRLWEFNDSVRFVGEAAGADCHAIVAALNGPDGGTEIGRAFDAVIATGKAKNVVIVTDGKSWAFDPQRLARTGICVTVVLIGEDALEAGIVHLAGMTGGQTFIATGSNADTAVSAAIEAARAPCVQPEPIDGTLSHIVMLRRGARIVAAWGEPGAETATAEARLVGATAAMLAIPLMREEAAAKLAESEGIVCHLTSLVLVDEAGEQHAGVPARRKVALTAPATSAAFRGSPRRAAVAELADACMAPPPARSRAGMPAGGRSKSLFSLLCSKSSAPPTGAIRPGADAPPPQARRTAALISLRGVASRIDWHDNPEALRRGHLSGLSPDVDAAIRTAAQGPEIIALAQALGLDPIVVVIALLARSLGAANRSAQRLARAILGKSPEDDIEAALEEVGLS